MKRAYRPIKNLSEREATRQYMGALNEIRKERGVLAAIGYEIKSTLYSLKNRVENVLEMALLRPSSKEHRRYAPNITPKQERRLKIREITEQIHTSDQYVSQRHGYILRGRKNHHDESGLASKVAGVVAILGIVGALVFAYPSVTGNAIGNLENLNAGVAGVASFFIGLIGVWSYLRFR